MGNLGSNKLLYDYEQVSERVLHLLVLWPRNLFRILQMYRFNSKSLDLFPKILVEILILFIKQY